MAYKVCILAAGVGSRMSPLSEHISKAILPINFKAVISHIIEKFPEKIEVVIAVGHKKETIKDYLHIAHPERKVTFVEVDNYFGPGTGPGYSLLQCRKHLDCPFIFFAADTLVLEDVPEPNENWFGIAPVKETERFCTVRIKNNLICQLDDKIKCDNKFAFIGLAGIRDYDIFFDALEKNKEIKSGEIQVSNGFTRLIENKLVPVGFTWFDTGTLQNYKETNESFSGGAKNFDFSKGNEFIYFVNEKVIKYFADENITKNRVVRAGYLSSFCPKIEAHKGNFYSYKKVDGHILYNVLNRQLVRDFLIWMKLNLWKTINLQDEKKSEFKDACKKFYYEKILERLKKFYEKTKIEDGENVINGVLVPPLSEMLLKIDWENLTAGIPSNFHGDLQFDNILVVRDSISNLNKFLLLDWRHDFGGLVEHGDLYYDLAKLYGGVTISYQLIKSGEFSFDMSGQSVHYNYALKNDILEAKEEYEDFINKNGFDLNKIKLLTALVFLNMAPLHNDPFDLLLYFMGKSKLYTTLKQMGVYKNDKF